MSDVTLSKAVRTNLLSLQNTANLMEKTQQRLATGNKVNSALDNPSSFFTASALNSRAADMNNLLDSMASGIKVLEAANNGLTALTKNLESMQSTLRQARQDKSFQTQSFDVTETSVLKLAGGQLANSVSDISLATAAIEGTKANLTTSATTPYRGPTIADGSPAGTGARTILNASAGFKAGDTFTVAGQTVTVTEPALGEEATAESVAANIRAALEGHESTEGKYTVTIGDEDSAYDGRIIIETVNPKGTHAEINLDPDNNPETGVGKAVKASTSFNYSDVSSTIQAGGQTIETGGSFERFVENLRAFGTSGNFTVEADDDTQQITLIAARYGDAPPEISGITPTGSTVEPRAAKLTFLLESNYKPASRAQTTFTLNSTTDGLSHDQTLTINITSGAEEIELEEGDSAETVETKLRNHVVAGSTLGDLYNITVDEDFKVSISTWQAGAALAPTVSSDVDGIREVSTMNAPNAGEDFTNPYSVLAGAKIVLMRDGQPNPSFTFEPQVDQSDFVDMLAKLNQDGYSAEITSDGLSISRSDGAAFVIAITNGAGGDAAAALGFQGDGDGSPIWVSSPSPINHDLPPNSTTPGDSGSATEFTFALGDDGAGTPALASHQTLNIGSASIDLFTGMTAAEVENAINANTAFAATWEASVASDFTVTVTAHDVGATPAPSVNTDLQEPSATTPTDGYDFTSVDDAYANLAGEKLTVTFGTTPLELEFTGTYDDFGTQMDVLVAAGFTVERTADGLRLSREDGLAFTFQASTETVAIALGHADAFGDPTEIDAGDIIDATRGITGGADGIEYSDGENEQEATELTGQRTLTINEKPFIIPANTSPTDLEAMLADDDEIGAKYDIVVTEDYEVTITAKETGAAGNITFQADGGLIGPSTNEEGIDAAEQTFGQPILATLGAYIEATIAAAKDSFTVTYGGKSATIEIGGVRGGIYDAPSENSLYDISQWETSTAAAINQQLALAGISGVEASFGSDGKLSIGAKNAEAQTLAITGTDAVALFGNNALAIGVAEKSGLTAIKTVDKFVELINRDFSGQVRASNDNGKLRIENLSTQALEIDLDNGNSTRQIKIDGNAVRANLSKEFNALRDQLDKLADDSSFNGINLLRGDRLKITFNESGSSAIDIQAKDKNGAARGLNAATLDIITLDAQDLDTDEKIDAFLSKLSAALSDLRSQASTFGSNLSSVQNRQDFTKSMITTLQSGAANLTLADMNEEAANLLALQTRQSLSTSALSMASQGDQNILQLLR